MKLDKNASTIKNMYTSTRLSYKKRHEHPTNNSMNNSHFPTNLSLEVNCIISCFQFN